MTTTSELIIYHSPSDIYIPAHRLRWLTPTGEFIAYNWGDHKEIAQKVLCINKWKQSWMDDCLKADKLINAGDWLSSQKGYVLIHNPGMADHNTITYMKPLTKAQREFLFEYSILFHEPIDDLF